MATDATILVVCGIGGLLWLERSETLSSSGTWPTLGKNVLSRTRSKAEGG
jgi:hypothetical protein